MCPFSTLNCELIQVSYHVLCIFTSLYFQTVVQCLWIHSNNIYWWRNAGGSEWSLPFWLVASLPLLLVNFHCGARTHTRSALLGAQYEVDSQRYWWKHVTLSWAPLLQPTEACTLKAEARVLGPILKWTHYPHGIFLREGRLLSR